MKDSLNGFFEILKLEKKKREISESIKDKQITENHTSQYYEIWHSK